MIHLEILPPSQLAFWEEDIGSIPEGWVLYGGTAIALHLGHRQSLDFDFFSDSPLDRKALRSSSEALRTAKTLQDEPDTLTVVVEKAGTQLKLSFFGGIGFGRVGEPLRVPGHYEIGIRIGELSLPDGFDGVLVWGRIYNRPFLRCLRGYGLCLWRFGRFAEALQVFERILSLNPNDNQGVRFCLDDLRSRRSWEEMRQREEAAAERLGDLH